MSRCVLLILLSCFSFVFSSASYGKKLALVIGIDDYRSIGKLNKAVNDAGAVAEALTSLGFDVTHLKNIDNYSMNLAIFGNFVPRISRGDEVVFYFAGHGVEVRNRNFLLASDIPRVKPNNERVIIKGGFAVDEIMQAIEEKGSRVALLILDACRNNPFPKLGTRSLGSLKGLGRSEPPRGTFVMYSAGARQEALDRLSDEDPNPNSIYTRKLIPLLKTPGLSLSAMAKRLRGEVEDLAKTVSHPQYPAYYDQLRGQYFLAGRSNNIEHSDTQSKAELEAMKKRLKALEAQIKKQKREQKKVAVGLLPKKTPAKKTRFVHGYKFDDCNGADWCPKMIVVRGDTFVMGSEESEKGRGNEEGPRRNVTIKKFAVGRFEVTFEEWDACVKDGGCRGYKPNDQGWGRDNRPVINVSWNDAQSYVKWLSRKTGKTYRLLTEAEWEYVASAKRPTAFWWGNSISTDEANYGAQRMKTVSVNSFKPNSFGLYNVHGNVLEWVEDHWHDSYKGAPTDGSAWLKGKGNVLAANPRQLIGLDHKFPWPKGYTVDNSLRVLRGGSWNDMSPFLHARSRFWLSSTDTSIYVGFRVARMLASES